MATNNLQPVIDDGNELIGHVPIRDSANPVKGVVRHHCGRIATVHAANGRRKGLLYLICDKTECGTDQLSGAEYQQKIKDGMCPTIEALEQAENRPKEPVVKNEQEDKPDAEKPAARLDVIFSGFFGMVFGGLLALLR